MMTIEKARLAVTCPTIVAGLTHSVVCDVAEFHALESQWRALERKSVGATIFQSFDWCRMVVEQCADELDGRLQIFCAYRGDELVALLPLKIWHKKFRKVLTGLAEPFQEFTEILAAPGELPEAIFAEFEASLHQCGADYLHFGQVRLDSVLRKGIDGTIPNIGEVEAAPYVAIHRWSEFSDYHETVRSKTRKNIRNARYHLEREGAVVHKVDVDGAGLTSLIDRTYEGRAEWLRQKGLTSSSFDDDGFKAFLDGLKVLKSEEIEVVAMSLQVGSKPIADLLGMVHGKRFYAFVSSWDSNYSQRSPGKMHLEEVVRACYGMDVKSVEFMIPAIPYKMTWASDTAGVQDHILGLSTRGKLFVEVWLHQLRPRVKQIYTRIPEGIRQKIMAGRDAVKHRIFD